MLSHVSGANDEDVAKPDLYTFPLGDCFQLGQGDGARFKCVFERVVVFFSPGFVVEKDTTTDDAFFAPSSNAIDG